MSTFHMYFNLGLTHIADFKGYDHILFIITLCAVYMISDWKKILILITAFTAGHSITLILATFNVINIAGEWIEFMIPITIFFTAIANITQRKESFSGIHHKFKYLMALFFGLIHGLGFSNYLRALLSSEKQLAGPLFSFNLGIELGQLLIVASFLILGMIFINVFQTRQREWNLVFSGAGLGVSLILIFERLPF